MSHLEYAEILKAIKTKSELHNKLITLLEEEEDVYTNKGRLNKSALSRILDIKPKELDDLFKDIQCEFVK